MIPALLTALALSLLLTIALETGLFLVIRNRGKGLPWKKAGNKKDLLLVLLVNIITNPVVVLLYWLTMIYMDFSPIIILMPLELFAILLEGYYYKRYGSGFRYPYLFSLAANAFSYGTGVLIQLILL